MRLVVGISGASGVGLGRRFIELLPKDVEPFVILTESAKVVFEKEDGIKFFDDKDISVSIASGSFKSDAMAIIPTSMNTLAKISVGISDNLTTRVASVMIKEKRPLLLAPREMPLSRIAIENMLKLSKIEKVIIAPPIIGYYADIKTLDDLERFIIGKWFDSLHIEHNLFKRWS